MNETNLSLKYLIDQLHKEQTLTKEEWITLIEGHTPELSEYLFSLAREERHRYYGHDVYVRGLIEFTNYCKNDCLYCGIRKSNGNAHRYRLPEADILKCCKEGYELGFRTFGWMVPSAVVAGSKTFGIISRIRPSIYKVSSSVPADSPANGVS